MKDAIDHRPSRQAVLYDFGIWGGFVEFITKLFSSELNLMPSKYGLVSVHVYEWVKALPVRPCLLGVCQTTPPLAPEAPGVGYPAYPSARVPRRPQA